MLARDDATSPVVTTRRADGPDQDADILKRYHGAPRHVKGCGRRGL
jgi:hypothetical protein